MPNNLNHFINSESNHTAKIKQHSSIERYSTKFNPFSKPDEMLHITKEGYEVDLHNSVQFNPFLLSKGDNKNSSFVVDIVGEVYNQLNIPHPNHMTETKKATVNNILSNVVKAAQKSSVVAISQNSNSFRGYRKRGLKHHTYTLNKQCMDALCKFDMIRKVVGYQNPQSNESFNTRIWATEKLLSLIEDHTKQRVDYVYSTTHQVGDVIYEIIDEQHEKPHGFFPIVVRDGKTDVTNLLNPKVKTLAAELNRYNDFMNKQTVVVPSTDVDIDSTSDNTLRSDTYYDQVSAGEGILFSPTNAPKHLRVVFPGADYQQTDNSSSTHSKGSDSTTTTAFNNNNNNNNNNNTITNKLFHKPIYYNRLDTFLYRVFNMGKLTHGGRLWGAAYQQLSSKKRLYIQINYNGVIEIDYSSLYPRLLYNLNGVSLIEDPYDLYEGNLILRYAVKKLFNSMLNSTTLGKGISGFTNEVYMCKKRSKKYFKMLEIRKELSKQNLTPKLLRNKILQNHPIISDYLGTDYGMVLQNIESRMAMDILLHFTDKHIPCLCIHDSFIVERQYTDELNEVMHKVYSKYTNGFECKTKIEEVHSTSLSEVG